MILRLIISRPVISLANAVVVGLCIFFIFTKENQIKKDNEKTALFKTKDSLSALTQLPFPINYTPKDYSDLIYRSVELGSDFLVAHEIYLKNRVE